MNIHIKKKLGSGVMGTVYLSEIDNKPAITKIEKYDGDLTTASNYIRQLAFDDVIRQCKIIPDNFLTLISSSIIQDCSHNQIIDSKIIKGFDPKLKKHLKEKERYKKCYVLSYTPVLDGTYASLKIPLSDENFISMLAQLTRACNFLHICQYRHRDVHAGNIMYKYDKIRDKYKWYLIDYGTIYHKSFTPNYDDESFNDNIPDLLSVIRATLNNKLEYYMYKNAIQFPPTHLFTAFIKRDKRYGQFIKPYLPKTNKANIISACIELITIINHYDLYMDALNLRHDDKKYMKYMSIQRYPDIYMYMIKHYNARNHDAIIKYILKN